MGCGANRAACGVRVDGAALADEIESLLDESVTEVSVDVQLEAAMFRLTPNRLLAGKLADAVTAALAGAARERPVKAFPGVEFN